MADTLPLKNFNWRVCKVWSSNSLAGHQKNILVLELYLHNKTISVEMAQDEIETFIGKLESTLNEFKRN